MMTDLKRSGYWCLTCSRKVESNETLESHKEHHWVQCVAVVEVFG